MAKARRDGSNLWYQVKGKGDHVITLIGGFALLINNLSFVINFLSHIINSFIGTIGVSESLTGA